MINLNELPNNLKKLLIGYLIWSFLHVYLLIIGVSAGRIRSYSARMMKHKFFPARDFEFNFEKQKFEFTGFHSARQTYDFSEFFVYMGLPILIIVILYLLWGKDRLLDKFK